MNEIFTEFEQAELIRSTDLGISAARGFAAKEASAKALGTGFGESAQWLDFEIGPAGSVRPVRLDGHALKHAHSLLPGEMLIECQTWVTQNREWILAVALISNDKSLFEDTLAWTNIFDTVVKPFSS